MMVFLNGRFVPEEQAMVSVFDRGFLYGDGLFETMLVRNGNPFRWVQHLERLQRGADFLKIKLPFPADTLRGFAGELIEKNQMRDVWLRLTLSRGVGVRGYSPKGADQPTLAMSLHPTARPALTRPPGTHSHSTGAGHGGDTFPKWRLITSSFRLPANDPLAKFKTATKLIQVLARAEADAAGADEALTLNADGHVAEGTGSNVFWINDGVAGTPPSAAGILPGVTRAIVFEICESLRVPIQESNLTRNQLAGAEAVFLTLSSMGLVEAIELDGEKLKRSPLVAKLQTAYARLVDAETAT